MSDNFRAIIIDDEKESIDLLLDHLKDYSEISILDYFQDPEEGIKGIIKHKPDILFLDIQMPVKDGFDVVGEIHENNLNPIVIFITGYDKFAIKAIKFAAFDYLLKPIDPNELGDTISKLINQNKDELAIRVEKLLDRINSNVKLKFNTCTGFIIIDSSDIVYCLADRNYSELYLTDERKEVVTCNLKKVHTQLQQRIFYRATRSLLINLDYLVKVDRSKKELVLKFEKEIYHIPIPKELVKELEQLIL